MAQTSDIIDDDERRAKDLWDALANLYTASNKQTVINLLQELEKLEYKEGSIWEEHLNKFHEILGKLASLGKAIPDEQKSSKLIRTLPDHFAPIAMISSQMSYEDLINAVETEISRRKLRHSDKSGVQVPRASIANRGTVDQELEEDESKRLRIQTKMDAGFVVLLTISQETAGIVPTKCLKEVCLPIVVEDVDEVAVAIAEEELTGEEEAEVAISIHTGVKTITNFHTLSRTIRRSNNRFGIHSQTQTTVPHQVRIPLDKLLEYQKHLFLHLNFPEVHQVVNQTGHTVSWHKLSFAALLLKLEDKNQMTQ